MSGFIVNIDVPDLNAAIDFYVEGLGFNYLRTLLGRSVAELGMAGTKVYLIEQPAGTRPVPSLNTLRSYTRHWTPIHIDIVVDDIAAAVDKALAAGAVRAGRQTTHPWGTLAPLADPFGHGICLVAFSKVGYDAVADK
ncbi:VOC family protein [Exilibacterium tricleocarpae]|nr:VOC family protein [Exilibacterium tricleocarpae]